MNTAAGAERASLIKSITLRGVREADLPIFFKMQTDPAANKMAAFTAIDPHDEAVFSARWSRILADQTIVARTILCGEDVVGNIASFLRGQEREVTYWLVKEYWGRGITSTALSLFLSEMTLRPLFGRAAKDNLASVRVLEKCGFTDCRQERGFANARGCEIEEVVLELREP